MDITKYPKISPYIYRYPQGHSKSRAKQSNKHSNSRAKAEQKQSRAEQKLSKAEQKQKKSKATSEQKQAGRQAPPILLLRQLLKLSLLLWLGMEMARRAARSAYNKILM